MPEGKKELMKLAAKLKAEEEKQDEMFKKHARAGETDQMDEAFSKMFEARKERKAVEKLIEEEDEK